MTEDIVIQDCDDCPPGTAMALVRFRLLGCDARVLIDPRVIRKIDERDDLSSGSGACSITCVIGGERLVVFVGEFLPVILLRVRLAVQAVRAADRIARMADIRRVCLN